MVCMDVIRRLMRKVKRAATRLADAVGSAPPRRGDTLDWRD
jgi:hypothetical protein